MPDQESLAARFEAQRDRLRGIALRMLGSRSEADDAVQDAWLKLSRAGEEGIDNLGGWLTTVVSRVCLDHLRARRSRPEDPRAPAPPEPAVGDEHDSHPAHDAELVDSVSAALLVVLRALPPAERVAFVLHDMFEVPFEDIAAIVERSPVAARQLASRARRRVHGAAPDGEAPLADHRPLVDAFLVAARGGDLQGLLAVLAPDVVYRPDAAAARSGARELRGADAVARSFLGRAQAARPALVDGALGLAVAPEGRLIVVLRVTVVDGKIAELRALADPAAIAALELAPLEA